MTPHDSYSATLGLATRLWSVGGAGATILLGLWGMVGSLHGSF